MSSIVSRWVVRREHRVEGDDVDADGGLRDGVIERWIDDARDAYLERCAVVQALIAGSKLVLQARPGQRPPRDFFGRPSTVVVSAGVTEVYPSAFVMAFRVRSYGQVGDVVANLTSRVSLVDPATGEPFELGDDVRDELIALEHGARHTN
jgi:acyl-CoA thioesterase FadM